MAQRMIDLDLIDPNPWQPRKTDDPEHIQNLAVSIAQDGLLQPPAARLAGERYQLVFGHSRYKAISFLNAADPQWFSEHGINTSNDYSCIPLEIIDLDDEGMYRQAVSENLQRRDLNPIEEAAAMQRAMTDFGYNSAQVGELFGRSDATVRGMIRYLDLPAGAKDLLGRGEISQNSARALLSMTKIAPADAVDKVAAELKNIDPLRTTPDTMIDRAVRNQANVISLYTRSSWSKEDDQKPRTGGGWLVEMKNFPNHMLPDFSAEELIEMFGFTPESRQWWMVKNHVMSQVELARMMKTSDYETDRPLGDQLAQLVDPPACPACQYYTKINGTHFCGLKICYERKGIAWRREIIRAAGKDLGIAVYSESDGAFAALDGYEDGKLFEKRHPNLRLIERNRIRGYPSQYSYTGIDDNYFSVVMVGRLLDEVKKERKEDRQRFKAGLHKIDSRSAMLFDRVEKLTWEAAFYFGDLFSRLNAPAMRALDHSTHYKKVNAPQWAVPDATASELVWDDHRRRLMGLNLIGQLPNVKACVAERARQIMDIAKDFGLIVPMMDMALKMDAEIDAEYPWVGGNPVAVETEVKYADK
jgi:ParB-like chromosome segregation protein Spo0J